MTISRSSSPEGTNNLVIPVENGGGESLLPLGSLVRLIDQPMRISVIGYYNPDDQIYNVIRLTKDSMDAHIQELLSYREYIEVIDHHDLESYRIEPDTISRLYLALAIYTFNDPVGNALTISEDSGIATEGHLSTYSLLEGIMLMAHHQAMT